MKMRWKLLNQRGERKRRGKEQTPTQTHLAQNGQPWKGKKRKMEEDGTEQDQRRRGKTEAPKPTYHSET